MAIGLQLKLLGPTDSTLTATKSPTFIYFKPLNYPLIKNGIYPFANTPFLKLSVFPIHLF